MEVNLHRHATIRKYQAISILLSILMLSHLPIMLWGQGKSQRLEQHNIVWTSQSKNSGESMPCGGGDIGLNVWVENGDVLFYVSRSGSFDENNALLKLGRVRLKLSPNPFAGSVFKQELKLREGYVSITGNDDDLTAKLDIWVDVFQPVVHVSVTSSKAVNAEAVYESWRHADRQLKGRENNANSYKWAKREVTTFKDEISFRQQDVQFFHRNKEETVFDVTVAQQGLTHVKSQMFNPLDALTFGGIMRGRSMVPAGEIKGTYLDTDYRGWRLRSVEPSTSHEINVFLHTAKAATVEEWYSGLQQAVARSTGHVKEAKRRTRSWWMEYWERSFVFIDPETPDPTSPRWQVGRNYQLFRYMLGCNAFGEYPTKFNGGLFTYDPSLVDSTMKFTPDHRNWGGGTMTAQNQRLVYFPMLKSGDTELMKAQFDFYVRALKNAEIRTKEYWGHAGACFTEQLENFGLPNCTEYGWDRPPEFDKGLQYNAWLEYQWDTVLEFCLMMLETERYDRHNISDYVPFIASCITFFDEHYQFLARKRGTKSLDGNGHLILYPGSACETYKMSYNATPTIAALKTILTRLLQLPAQYHTKEERTQWNALLNRIPPIGFRDFNGYKTIAPATHWERINNTETPQLYPVFPWGLYGLGQPDLDIAINTYKYDPDALRFRSHVGWKQDNIFAARLGLTDDAAAFTTKKLQDSGRRFPAFWGPGYDWTPDHNWGGSGMIGLQEMLMQVNGKEILLFPAWPREWNVHFKLHAPYNTTIECQLEDGMIKNLIVSPPERKADVVNYLVTRYQK